jgi:hypothetical protein
MTAMNDHAETLETLLTYLLSRGVILTDKECEALRAAIALMRGHSWQPIETASKDGSYVLVANSHGSWIAKLHPVYQSGYRPSTPWASMMLNHDHIEKPGRFDKPTHWQPLPAPPKDSADEQ